MEKVTVAVRYAAMYNSCHEGIKRDWGGANQYWRQNRVLNRETTQRVIDTNLKLHRVKSGVASYGKVLELLIADWRSLQENDGSIGGL